jgi:hypothetical protein
VTDEIKINNTVAGLVLHRVLINYGYSIQSGSSKTDV